MGVVAAMGFLRCHELGTRVPNTVARVSDRGQEYLIGGLECLTRGLEYLIGGKSTSHRGSDSRTWCGLEPE